MSFNRIFMWFVSAGAVIGGIDYLMGSRLGLGRKFKEGFDCIATLSLSMTGIIVVAPVLARFISPAISPLFRSVGMDPAMLSCFFSPTMGGYDLAMNLADTPEMGLFSGLVVSGLLGTTISYTIPMGMGVIDEKDKDSFIKGLLLSVIPMPVGCFVGGILMGLPMKLLGRNLVLVCGMAVLLVAGLVFFREKTIRGFTCVANGIKVIAVAGLVIGAVQSLTGLELLKGTTPVMEAIQVPANTALTLMGCLPLIEIIWKLFKQGFEAVGRKININGVAVEGFLLGAASAIAVFKLVHFMNPKGKVAVVAWVAGAMGIFTAYMAYCMKVAPEMVMPQMAARSLSGFLGFVIACAIPSDSVFYEEK